MAIEINYSETSGPNIDTFIKNTSALTCFLPICPHSFMENRAFLQDYLRGVLPHCFRVAIVIGDYLDRHNIMAFEYVSEVEAISKAEKRGRKIKRTIESVLEDIKPEGIILIDSCKSYMDDPDFPQIVRTIRNYCDKNTAFRSDIEEQVLLMLKNSKRVQTEQFSLVSTEIINLLREYMIEELALYILLYHRGYTTEIYPGRDMKVLRSMSIRKYLDFPFDFSKRTHISIAVLLDGGICYARLDENKEEGE